MPRTIAEIQAELTTINAALQEIIAGNRLTQLRVGSGEFARLYVFAELTYENLVKERDKLNEELSHLQDEEPSFRKYSHIKLVVTKFGR